MDTMVLLAHIAFLRLIILSFDRFFSYGSGTFVLVAFLLLMAFLVPLPLVLIKKEVLENSVINVVISVISVVYLGLVIARALDDWKR